MPLTHEIKCEYGFSSIGRDLSTTSFIFLHMVAESLVKPSALRPCTSASPITSANDLMRERTNSILLSDNDSSNSLNALMSLGSSKLFFTIFVSPAMSGISGTQAPASPTLMLTGAPAPSKIPIFFLL